LKDINSEFCIQDKKILLLVDNASSYSSPKLSNNMNKTVSINNVKPDFRDNDEAERSLEKQRGSTRGRPHGSTHRRPYESTCRRYIEVHTEGLVAAHIEKQKLTPILLPDMDTVDQLAKGKILLENNEIKKIVANLPDENLYAPETAQAITTYLQIVDESVATEEILDDKEIISMVQANKNKTRN
ncbi:43343_t:CDS:2, partial [Gigaspora margarita]